MILENRKIGIILTLNILLMISSAFGVESIMVTSSKKRVFVGESVELNINISINEKIDTLIIYPPNLDSLDGVEVTGVAGTSTSSNGQVIQSYKYQLKLNKLGEIKIDPLVIKYRDKNSDSEKQMQAKGVTIAVEEYSALKSNGMKAIVVGVVTLLAFGIAMFLANKRDRKNIVEVKNDSAKANEILLKIRKAKVEGDTFLFFDEVVKLMDMLKERGDEYENYKNLRDKAKFGSGKFKQEDISAICKLMENKIRIEFKDKEDELSGIKFEG